MTYNQFNNGSTSAISPNGRLCKRDYWVFALKHLGFILIAGVASTLLRFPAMITATLLYATGYFCVLSIYSIRRMHDVSKSGWYLFIPIYNVILLLRRGDRGENKFGPDPDIVFSR